MTSYLAARKALYRRLYAYKENPFSTTILVSYMMNRLDNGQLRDVLDLLDNDPEVHRGAQRRRQPPRTEDKR